MASVMEAIRQTFWSENFWFPNNMSWDIMKNTNPNIYKPQLSDLMVPVYACFVICIIRIIFERCVGSIVSRTYNLRRTNMRKAPPNPILEKAYLKYKIPGHETMEMLSKQTDLTVRQVERWIRIRCNQDKTPVIKKFCESSWRCIYYAVLLCYGTYVLWDKSWLWDTRDCWIGWPEHHVPTDIYWYYVVEAGFYLSLCLSLFTDHKRKDFTEMIVHHVATLGLMFMSWMLNMVRIGSLVLLLHDCADPFMEAAKMAKYLKKETATTALFVMFLLTWVATRMTLFPFRLIYSTLFEAVPVIGMCNIYYAFNGQLITLQVLHCIWFYFILVICKEALVKGQLDKDSRSSDDDDLLDDPLEDQLSDSKAKVLEQSKAKLLEKNGVSSHVMARK